MRYVKANSNDSTSIWHRLWSVISTAPVKPYPVEREGLIDLSAPDPTLQPSRSGFHPISSTRGWWTSRAIE